VFLLQNDLDSLCSWCKLNLLELNIKKCVSMSFSRIKSILTCYYINGFPLDKVTSVTDLGVLFDNKLKFNCHIEYIINKACKILGCIKRWAKDIRDPYVTKILFTSLVRPISTPLSFGVPTTIATFQPLRVYKSSSSYSV